MAADREMIALIVRQAVRNATGGDIQAFADLLGVGRSNLDKYLRGAQVPSAYTCRRIAALGNVSAAELLEFSDHEPEAAVHEAVEFGLLAVAPDYLAVPIEKRPALLAAWKAVATAVR